jgi:chorismate mutase/prephenate dehydratase
MTIDDLRARIDGIDERLVELLNERMTCALEIGVLKHQLGLEIYQPDREKAVVRHVQECGQRAQGPLGREALARVFERIIDEARHLERAAARTRQPSAPDDTSTI